MSIAADMCSINASLPQALTRVQNDLLLSPAGDGPRTPVQFVTNASEKTHARLHRRGPGGHRARVQLRSRGSECGRHREPENRLRAKAREARSRGAGLRAA